MLAGAVSLLHALPSGAGDVGEAVGATIHYGCQPRAGSQDAMALPDGPSVPGVDEEVLQGAQSPCPEDLDPQRLRPAILPKQARPLYLRPV